MKTFTGFVLAALMVATAAARPQDAGTITKNNAGSEVRISRVGFPLIIKNYMHCLDSDIPSVVESALGHVTFMRIAFPGQDLSKIQEKLVYLTTHGMTRAIRCRAFMALEVYGEPSAFCRFIERRQANGDGLLDEIGTRILPPADLVTK
jgi:hypothetical protein